MKNKLRKMLVLLFMLTVLTATGCDTDRKTGNTFGGVTETEVQQNTDAQMSLEQQIQSLDTIRIAVIDTGFSSLAIPQEKTLEGSNYVEKEASTEDTYGHGTAVASVILANTENARLVPLVSSRYENGKIKQVEGDVLAQMLRDAVDVYDCRIINISAGLGMDLGEVRDAVQYAEEKNVLIVASVGNDYEQNGSLKYYPAAYDSVLAVGSCTEEGNEISAFSQRGSWVDIYEPGENVQVKTLSGNTYSDSGTSYSAALITARAADLITENTDITAEEIRRLMTENVK